MQDGISITIDDKQVQQMLGKMYARGMDLSPVMNAYRICWAPLRWKTSGCKGDPNGKDWQIQHWQKERKRILRFYSQADC